MCKALKIGETYGKAYKPEFYGTYIIKMIAIITSIPFPNKFPIKCAVIGTYTFLVLIYEILNGNAHIIVKNIPHIVNECSKAYKNILNKVVNRSITLL